MAITRVQATPLATAAATTSITVSWPTPPTIGNAVVVVAGRDSGIVPVRCVDNYQNAYHVAAQNAGSSIAVAIYYCPTIARSGAGFITTVSSVETDDWAGVGIELASSAAIGVDRSAIGQAVSGTAATTAASAALRSSDVFAIAAVVSAATQTSITVQSVAPAWTQEAEYLSSVSAQPLEVDTRTLTGVSGTTSSVAWTLAASSAWATALALFTEMAGGSAQLSHAPLEVVRQLGPALTDVSLRLSHAPIEVVREFGTTLTDVSLRLSHLAIEVVRSPTPEVVVSERVETFIWMLE